MPYELNMPQLSDTMTEGTLVKWNKKEGDAVKAGEEIADVETDKATMPMESAEGGVVAVLLAKEGDKVAVGGTIGVVALKGENPADVKAKYAGGAKSGGAAPAKAEAKAESSSNGGGTATATKLDEGGEVTQGDHPATEQKGDRTTPHTGNSTSGHHPAGAASADRLRISPLARRVADDKGVDPSSITGSGPNGRIVQKDVLAAADKPAAKPSGVAASAATDSKPAKPKPELPARLASGATEKIELNKMRQVIAARLQQSKQNIPHFYESIDIDMTASNELRKKLLAAYEKSEGLRISVGDIIAKAVACALKSVPQMNATFDEKTNTITRYGDVNLGMPVALPDGH
jgi:pyruvate dehydrogenase E2 component (dihydrolipoamide acetyltransferase)